jgi:serine/threonine-protein kinase RsbW
MRSELSLSLPRDGVSVPISRRITAQALRTLGVDNDCTSDIEVALTEACTNVLDHVGDGDEYDVHLWVDGDLCVIEVIDTGRGFDASALGHDEAAQSAEAGRGIQRMRSLVDRVLFTNRPESGTIVHLEKDVLWRDDALVRALDPA